MMTVLRQDLEASPADRHFGSGWISGALALMLSVLGLGTVLCLCFPELLTVADARKIYNVGLIRLALHVVLIAGFLLATLFFRQMLYPFLRTKAVNPAAKAASAAKERAE
jgi:hypothetical protein